MKKNHLTVFEPKHTLREFYGTDAIPLSHSATFHTKCLKWDLKDNLICLELACFQPKNKTEN